MSAVDVRRMTVAELVEQFTDLCLQQFAAELRGEHAKENALIRRSFAVADELKARDGDQRRALVPLLSHPNPQVRLMAAEFTLSIAPSAARQVLQNIWNRKEFPQAAQAMGTLRALDRGDRVPN